jgi:hypothetical protein
MKQTAVELLFDYLVIEIRYSIQHSLEQAKAMQKQQIIDAHNIGRNDKHNDFDREGEQYYNETYKSE